VRYADVNGATTERAPALLRPSAAVLERPGPTSRAQGVAPSLAGSVTAIERNPCLVLGWAEAAGWGLVPALALATQVPAATAALTDRLRRRFGTPSTGRLDVVADVGLTRAVDAAADFLTSTGVVAPARLVVLVGHGASVTNNPHVAAYDCGACGGAAGDVSARVMAATLNDERVRGALRERGLAVPTGTRFVAALHDTTTDEVRFLDRELVPTSHRALVAELERDLGAAGADVLAERLPLLPDVTAGATSRRAARRRAMDWAQPRPEWGLAGASAIVVGPRTLTQHLDLEGQVFLQSYRPDLDPDGSVLASLLEAPVVVAHWITSQYRASTLDPHRLGAGDKTTHNVVGDGRDLAAVITGARGDLRVGLPWQAVASRSPAPRDRGAGDDGWTVHLHHVPRRLLVAVCADVELTEAALARSRQAAQLVAGEWITLCSVDPRDGSVRRRRPDGSWCREAGPRRLKEHLQEVA
jgi:uncharacterized protein YbcC (UPF0753/DUF2309 family)